MVERNADTPEAKRVNPKLTVNFDAWEPARASYLQRFDDRVRRMASNAPTARMTASPETSQAG
jgi:hypothetical protein